ncbi:FAD-dependent oxidoreductase [Pseudomonas sp.]|uniref:FAD-dependent oxidoreductase n=1 Tax=Pseudomonas sp. TaxID=306 RepID=UPI003CC6223F
MMAAPLIMVGAGHAHLVTLRDWIKQGYRAPAGSLLVTPESDAWYSGMMPGLLAGRWQAEQCRAALAPLCRAAGISLQLDRLSTLDAERSTLQLASGAQLTGQVISLDCGAGNPAPANSDGSVELIGAKPFGTLYRRWRQWRDAATPARIAVLGGGPAAVELVLALQRALPNCQLTLICAGPLLGAQPHRAARITRTLLTKRGIPLYEQHEINRIQGGSLLTGDGRAVRTDAVVLATGTAAAPWQEASALATDGAGFIRITDTLQSQSHPHILASGDCATLAGCPHSGVYAVRQGAVLGHNLRALLTGSPALHHFQPQPRALALLATADAQALACYGPLALRSRAARRLKDHLDSGFMRSLQVS